MKRLLLASVVLTAVLLGVVGANACGDKLLALGRGVRFTSAYRAAHPAHIVALDRDNAARNQAEVRATLTRVGHQFDVALTPEELGSALQARRYDLVILDIADAVAVEHVIDGAANKPAMLVLVTKPTKIQMQAAEKRYRWAVKAPATLGEVLAAIDSAMDYRAKHPDATASLVK
jgi:DNA-binding NtrC family response regulator